MTDIQRPGRRAILWHAATGTHTTEQRNQLIRLGLRHTPHTVAEPVLLDIRRLAAARDPEASRLLDQLMHNDVKETTP